MSTHIQLRRDTAVNWTAVDPVLADGELGLETDTGALKLGDGAMAWTSLSYFGGITLPRLAEAAYPADADNEEPVQGRDSRLAAYPWKSGRYSQSPGTGTSRVTARSMISTYTRPHTARISLQSAEDAAWTAWFEGVNGLPAYAGSEAETGTLWSCGYEAGDLRDQGVWPNGGYIPSTGINGEAEVTSAAAHTGRYGVRLRIPGGLGTARAQLNRSLDAQGNNFTDGVEREYRISLRINDLVARNRGGDSPDWWNIWQLITPGEACFSMNPVLRNGDRQYAFQCIDKVDGSASVLGESQTFSVGEWVTLRARWKPHTTTGTFSVYVNEVLCASKVGATRDASLADTNRFEYGPYSDNLPAGEYSIDYDDASIRLVSGASTITPTALATVTPHVLAQKTVETTVPAATITAALDVPPVDGDTTSIVAFLAIAGTRTLGAAPTNWTLRHSNTHDGITTAVYYQRMLTFGGPYTGLGTFTPTWTGGDAHATVILTHLAGAYNNYAHFDDTDKESRLNPAVGATRLLQGRAPQRTTSGKTLELCFLAQLGDSIVDTPGRDLPGTLLPSGDQPVTAPVENQPRVVLNMRTPAAGEPAGWYYSLTDAQWLPWGWIGNAGAPTYRASVLADSPILLLGLDDTTGTVAVELVAGRNGAYVNTPTLAVAGAGAGTGTAVLFAGASSQYLTVTHNAAFNVGDVFTVEAWVKGTYAGATQTLLSKGTSGGNAYAVEQTTGGAFRLTQVFVGTICTSTSTDLNDGNWHHIVATKNGATTKLYNNGVDVTGAVTDHTMANNATAFSVGTYMNAGAPGGQYARATIDEVALYATALSQARVQAHYAAKDIATSSGVQMDVWGAAAPVAGYHQNGERVWNAAPSAGGTMGWVCTTAGTPGTWKTFGAITA